MQHIQEHLSYFLSKGKFKELPFGISLPDFFNKLEQSEYVYPEPPEQFSIISYGITEFYFSKCHSHKKLDGIVIKPPYHVNETQHLNFQLETEWLKYRTTYQEVLTNLRLTNADFAEKKDEVDQYIIETSGGVAIMFYDNEEQEKGEWELCKIGRFNYD